VSRVSYSAALPGPVDEQARAHLIRRDLQEDLCFALWNPSTGRERTSALVQRLILPALGERNIHGNVSFQPRYFERALAEAAAASMGLALLHSHPCGRGWQRMSEDDIAAEQGHAAAVRGATGLPFVGLTLAGVDGAWSARFWERIAPRLYERRDCGSVRVIGDQLKVTYADHLAPPPHGTKAQIRTISAWGEHRQKDLARLRIGVIGAGSVGGFVAEALARTGFEDITVVDFDLIEEKNLDRLLYAIPENIGAPKVEKLAQHLGLRATAERFHCHPVQAAVYEEAGFRAALDCDALVSCVDRPWGRYALNMIAYAHLIPVIDGGVAVRTNHKGELVKADWRAHTATIGRQCLECLGQYETGYVQAEREGFLDDPTYIENLDRDHPLRSSENVVAFSMACGSLQVLQLLALVISPLDQPNPGAQLYHFVGGFMECPVFESCKDACLLPSLIALGDKNPFTVVGNRH
jgi:molybdopterin-synthase adenylyltransferase